jgi:ABC-2 type transport system permease protein
MYIVLAVIVIGGAAITAIYDDTDGNSDNDNWQEALQQENDTLTKENEDADEDDAFIIDMNNDTIAENNYHLENDIAPVKYGAWQYTIDNSGLLSIVSLLSIIVAAGIVANEFRWGSIKLLLIRPISRTKILISKYIAVLLFALFTLVFMLVVNWITGALFFGVEGMNPDIVLNKSDGFQAVSVVSEVVSGYGYGLVNLVMMTTFAFMISAVFRNSALAIGTAIFLMFAGNTIVAAFAERPFAKYILFANTNLKQYADGDVWIKGMTLGFSITVLIVYYIVFVALAWIFFTKRDVAGQ